MSRLFRGMAEWGTLGLVLVMLGIVKAFRLARGNHNSVIDDYI